ncbi:hypothetical protein, partial [Treponema sp. R80B11-R83G3]
IYIEVANSSFILHSYTFNVSFSGGFLSGLLSAAVCDLSEGTIFPSGFVAANPTERSEGVLAVLADKCFITVCFTTE